MILIVSLEESGIRCMHTRTCTWIESYKTQKYSEGIENATLERLHPPSEHSVVNLRSSRDGREAIPLERVPEDNSKRTIESKGTHAEQRIKAVTLQEQRKRSKAIHKKRLCTVDWSVSMSVCEMRCLLYTRTRNSWTLEHWTAEHLNAEHKN